MSAAVLMMIVSVAGFIATLVLNAFFLDKYNAYGEVPVPGSKTVQLPAGEVTINLHAVVIGGTGTGMPVPPLGVTIIPPDARADRVELHFSSPVTKLRDGRHVDANAVNPGYREIRMTWAP